MEFGLSSIKKTIKGDEIDKAIISIVNKSTTKQMHFNLNAFDILGLSLNEKNEIAISFSNAHRGDIYLINGKDFDSKSNIVIQKNRKLTSKKYCDEIIKYFTDDKNEEIQLEIVKTDREFDGKPIFKLVLYKEIEENKVVNEQKIEETEENNNLL